MADIEIDEGRGTTLLPGAHRVIRTLDVKEGPYVGTLVTSGDGVAVRVDAAVLGGWAGWHHSGAEHIAAPIDVCRRSGGQDVLLPWCTDRVLGLLVRRAATGGALTSGECSTLVISLLRGLDELGEGVEGVRSGVWWLTDGGRPVFVFGVGPDARAGAAEIVARLGEDAGDKALKRVLGVVERGLKETADHPRLPRKLLEAWEQELASIAAPQPLERATPAPERASEIAGGASTHDLLGLRSTSRSALRSRRGLRTDRARAARGLVARGAEVGEAVRAGIGSLLARARELSGGRPARRAAAADAGERDVRARTRRKSLILAGGVAAAVVLAGGLLWPAGGAPGETADAAGRSATDAPSGAHGAGTGPEPLTATGLAEDIGTSDTAPATPEPSDDDPVSAASALLKTISDCRDRGDSSCPGGVVAGSSGIVDALEAAEQGNPSFELVDDYGGVAVLRLDVTGSGSEPAENAEGPVGLIVVLLRENEKWLVRDVYDVADQPG